MTNLKDSGVYWLGEVASNFDIVPSTILFRERSEKNLEDDIHLTPSQKYGVLPQDKYQEITGGKVMQKLSDSDMKHVEPNDFVIHLRSFQGGIERSQIRGKVSTAYTVLEPRDGVFTGYWRYFLKSAPFIEGMASSTNQLRDGQTINYARFSRLKLLRPPLETQRRIADYLDKEISEMDTLIEEFEELVTSIESRRGVYLQSKFDPAVTGDASMKMGTFAQISLGKTFQGEPKEGQRNAFPVNYVRAANIQPHGKLVLDEQTMYATQDEIDKYTLKAGDVVIVEGGAGFGRSLTLQEDLPGWIFQNHVIRMIPHPGWLGEFFDYTIRAHLFSGYIELQTVGATIPGLSSEKVANFPVAFISPDEQKNRVLEAREELCRMDTLIEESTRLIENLKARKTALITEVVTGRKEV